MDPAGLYFHRNRSFGGDQTRPRLAKEYPHTYGTGDFRGDHRQAGRSILHDQGSDERNGIRAFNLPCNHQEPWWIHADVQRAGPGRAVISIDVENREQISVFPMDVVMPIIPASAVDVRVRVTGTVMGAQADCFLAKPYTAQIYRTIIRELEGFLIAIHVRDKSVV